MKSIIVFLSFLLALIFTSTTQAQADVKNCIPVFNGGESCTQPDNIELDKFIQNPADNTYLDNLDQNTQNVNPGQTINFRLTLKSKVTNKLNNIKVIDTLPQSLEFVSASNDAKYDKEKHTVTYEVDLEGGKSQNLTLTTKVAISTQEKSSCIANQALADVAWKKAMDNTQFCIGAKDTNVQLPAGITQPQSQNQPELTQNAPVGTTTKGGKTLFPTPQNVTNNPNTGPEAFALIALLPAAISGYLIRHKAK